MGYGTEALEKKTNFRSLEIQFKRIELKFGVTFMILLESALNCGISLILRRTNWYDDLMLLCVQRKLDKLLDTPLLNMASNTIG